MIQIDNSQDFITRAIDTSNGFNDCKPEEVQKFLTPLYEKSKEKNPEINQTIEDFSKSFARSCNNMCKPYRVILLLSANQFTVTEPLSPQAIVRSIRSKQLNKLDEYLLTQSGEGKEFDIQKTLDSLIDSQHIVKHKENVQECINAFNNRLYFPTAVGIISIVDGIISDISNDQKTSFSRRIDKIQKAASRIFNNTTPERKSKDVDFLNRNIAFISFYTAQFDFFNSSNFSNKEPLSINRHWIMHGRSSRHTNKLDCIKLFRLLNTLIKTKELLLSSEQVSLNN